MIGDKFSADSNIRIVTEEEGIPDGWEGFDIGPKSRELFSEVILRSRCVLWNG